MPIFEYNKSNKKNKHFPNQTTKTIERKHIKQTNIPRFEYLIFGFTIADVCVQEVYECSFHTVLSTKSRNSVCKRVQTRGDSRFTIQDWRFKIQDSKKRVLESWIKTTEFKFWIELQVQQFYFNSILILTLFQFYLNSNPILFETIKFRLSLSLVKIVSYILVLC